MVGYFPAKFVMKIEETEKPFLVVKHCFGNSRRKELKAKENTVKTTINILKSGEISKMLSFGISHTIVLGSLERYHATPLSAFLNIHGSIQN